MSFLSGLNRKNKQGEPLSSTCTLGIGFIKYMYLLTYHMGILKTRIRIVIFVVRLFTSFYKTKLNNCLTVVRTKENPHQEGQKLRWSQQFNKGGQL